MSKKIERNPVILKRERTALIIIDLQERIMNVMGEKERVISNALKLIRGFKVLHLPIFYTEQYPKGLGATCGELKEELEGLSAVQKLSFSCYGAENFFQRLIDNDIEQIVISGVESHVCVQQTVLDLIANGFQVNIAADAVSSRKEFDYMIALDRMNAHGAEITTTESVLFELLQNSGSDEFKAISKLVK
jgi:isochorismate hydrolase